jgi:cyclopropane fatty-acyl-phospholipid synthase-like methyltransferase
MTNLSDIYEKYKYPDGDGDKGTAHTYIQEYETLLHKYRTNPTVSFLEIGVSWGLSIRMWTEYFAGNVTGVDIRLHEKTMDLRGLDKPRLIEADATQESFLSVLGSQTFDIIIDDGSHKVVDQVASFNLLKERVRPGGIYVIEDIENLDYSITIFQQLHPTDPTIIDNRSIKGRYDDVLIVYQF